MAVPSEIEVNILSIEEFARQYAYKRESGKRAIVLFRNIADACRAYKLGFHFDKLNIGNIYNEKYKLCCAPSVFLCDSEIQDIVTLLENAGVLIELKRVPREMAVNIRDALKDYCPITP